MEVLDNAATTPASMSAADKRRAVQLLLARSSVLWMQVICIASVINAVAILIGARIRLIIGLAFTDLAVSMAKEAGGVALALAMIAAIGIAGGMYLLEWLFKKTGRTWIAIVVAAFYALDILPVLILKSFVGVGHHVVGIFVIVLGVVALRAAQKEQAASAGAQAVRVQVREVPVLMQAPVVEAPVQVVTAPPQVVAAPVAPAVPAGWYADPSGRHQYRYWDSRRWTTSVLNNGVASLDSAGA